jgi:hypothetical protein
MMTRIVQYLLAATAVLATWPTGVQAMGSYEDEFGISKCKLLTTGRNDYFILEPGYQLVLEGGNERLQITVLNETKTIGGVTTRVVEEREWQGDKLKEVSRNYFAICEQTKDVFYFGEDVDNYKDGKVDNHKGSWLAGVNGNRPGLIMPGAPKSKMRYYQEIAPGVAMDRAEIVSLDETCTTPAGTFQRCMKVKEGSAIEFWAKEYKYHAPGIGLVRDEDLQLVKYGFIKDK